MSITASDLRLIKKAVCDRVAAVTGIGEVIPSRMTFADKAEYFSMVTAKPTQKQIETGTIACAMVHMLTPRRRIDDLNDKIFRIDYAVRVFREAFPGKVDQTTTPDSFRKKILASEDSFDTAVVNLGFELRETVTVSGLSADMTAAILPLDTDGAEIQFGEPEQFPTVAGHYIDLTVTVEAVYDDC